jgi:hypothetical protein
MAHQAPKPIGKEPLQHRSSVTGSGLQTVLIQVMYQLALQILDRVETNRQSGSEQTFCQEQVLQCALTVFTRWRMS